MQYSPNKWRCLKLTSYNKILFCDVDILPVSSSFYDIFDYNTPAIYRTMPFLNLSEKRKFNLECINNNEISDKNSLSYNEYIRRNTTPIGSMDGVLYYLKPDIELYEKYFKFINEIYDKGTYSVFHSGEEIKHP